jgi:neuralized-like protein 4
VTSVVFIRELSTAEESGTEISHSKSCEARLEDPSSLLPVTGTALGAETEPAVRAVVLEFHENHGRNVQLGEGRRTAKRTASYNQGVVISSKPLPREQLFQVTECGLSLDCVRAVPILCGNMLVW